MSDPMESAKKPGRLHLVLPKERRSFTDDLQKKLPAQISLFPNNSKRIIVFVTFSRISDSEFVETLNAVRPHVVVDIRRFPRFDNGKLNRAAAFEYFEKTHAKYVDMLWSYDSSAEEFIAHPVLSPDLVAINGPVMVLLEAKQCQPEIVDTVTRQITTRSNHQWDVIGVPNLCSGWVTHI